MNRNFLSISRIIVTTLFVLSVAGYALFQTHKLIVGPVIDIYSPKSGTTYGKAIIQIDGRANNASYLNMDGRKIFTDTRGRFIETLLLSPGYNIIVLNATDKFGKTTEKRIELILNDWEPSGS